MTYQTKKLSEDRRELFTTKDVSEIMGFDISTIRRHISTGKLKSIKIGRLHLIYPKDLSTYIDSHYSLNNK